jgi:hypothetical protein
VGELAAGACSADECGQVGDLAFPSSTEQFAEFVVLEVFEQHREAADAP